MSAFGGKSGHRSEGLLLLVLIQNGNQNAAACLHACLGEHESFRDYGDGPRRRVGEARQSKALDVTFA
jgi:hypothetical protein